MRAVCFDDVVFNEGVGGPAVDGEVGVTVGREGSTIFDLPALDISFMRHSKLIPQFLNGERIEQSFLTYHHLLTILSHKQNFPYSHPK